MLSYKVLALLWSLCSRVLINWIKSQHDRLFELINLHSISLLLKNPPTGEKLGILSLSTSIKSVEKPVAMEPLNLGGNLAFGWILGVMVGGAAKEVWYFGFQERLKKLKELLKL